MVVGTRIDLRLGIVGVGRIRRLLLRVHCEKKKEQMRWVGHKSNHGGFQLELLGFTYRASDTAD